MGLAPRPLANLVNAVCPWPTGIEMMSGAMPGDTTAPARTDPCADATSTTSPAAMPSFSAVFELIYTQLHHIADVSGSGNSCSHGRCASDPSRNAVDAYGRK